jgi:hypothetical protein
VPVPTPRPLIVARLSVILAALAAARAGAQVDLRIIDLPDVISHGVPGGGGGIAAYSVGFTVCNNGTVPASWQSSTSLHPVEAWGMYRVGAGKIEQLGVSWVKHGNFAASTPGCGACNTTINGARLGPGCRDTYDAAFNSSQFGLGPRSDIDAAAGVFPYPPTIGHTQTGNAVFKRCQVPTADLAVPGFVYLFEGVIAQPEDAAAGNGLDNATYRLATVAGGGGGGFPATLTGASAAGQPAIRAWRDHGLGVNIPDPEVTLTPVDIAGDGRIWVGSRATDLGGGRWRYEYAVENLNSTRGVAGFVVPLGTGVAAEGTGFHDIAYHSGDPTDGADWAVTTGGGVRWATVPHAVNPAANALRWGTLYNFRFEAARPPASGAVTLEMFRPGTPASVQAAAVVPRPPACAADFNGVGGVTVQDLFDFLAPWFTLDPRADFDGAGGVTLQDLLDFLGAYFAGCP